MTKTSELTHLFRALKAPAAARAAAEARRARPRGGVVATSASSRPCSRPRSPRGSPTAARAGSRRRASRPARRSRSSTSPSSARSRSQVVEHLGQLDFLHAQGERRPARPARAPARRIWRSRSRIRACLAGQRVRSRPRPSGWRGSARPSARAASRPSCAASAFVPADRRRRGRLHPVRPRGREPDVQPRLRPLRARLDDRHLEQAVLGLGRDLRRRGRRRGDDRPARPPRRDPRRSRATATGCATRTWARRRRATDRPACSASPYGLGSAGGT